MKIPFKEKWQLFEREDYANYFFVYSTWEGYTHLPQKWGFPNGRFLSAEFINGACNLFMPEKYNDEIVKLNYRSLFNDSKKWDNLHKINDFGSKKMFVFSRGLLKKNIGNISNKEIYNILKKFFEIQNLVHVPRGPIWQLETPKNLLNNYLNMYLEDRKKETKEKIETGEAFRILTTPLSANVLETERLKLIKIALLNDEEQSERLSRHAKEYEWLEYGLQGKILTLSYFAERLEEIKSLDPKKQLSLIEQEKNILKEEQRSIVFRLKIGHTHKKIFEIVKDSLYSRLYSKYAQFYGYYCIENILKVIGKKFDLTLEEVRFLMLVDFEEMLIKNGKTDWGKVARDRKEYSVHFSDKGNTALFVGDEARGVMKKIKFQEEKREELVSDILKGQVAYKGKARGRIKIVNVIQEIAKMHDGNILVSHMTNPDIVPAMRMARAIITDLGGITSHAAIVARELKKPCIIGTKVATRILKDGDLVEVNDDGQIIILNRHNGIR